MPIFFDEDYDIIRLFPVPVQISTNLSAQPKLADDEITYYTLPPDRGTTWNPGVVYNGGTNTSGWFVWPTVNATGSNDATKIQTAINSAHSAHPTGVIVPLSPGNFNCNDGIIFVPSNTVLRGQGAGITFLNVTNGATVGTNQPGAHNAPIVIIGPSRFSDFSADHGVSSSTNLSADALKGSYSISITSATGFSAGQYVLLDELSGASFQTDPSGQGQIWAAPDWRVVWQLHNPGLGVDDPLIATTPTSGNAASWFCRTDRPQAEIKKIASISGTTITFTTPIHITYRTSHTAQLSRYETTPTNLTFVEHGGLEGVTGTGGDDGCFRMMWAAFCWVNNCEVTQWLNEGVAFDSTFCCEMRHTYVHDGAWPVPGGGGYAISWSASTSEALIEDCITVRTCKNMVSRCSGAGSVVGYNYFDQSYDAGMSWMEVGANASHMVGSHHVLFEGNYSQNFDSDKTHGSSTNITTLRNWFRGIRAPFHDILDGNNGNGAIVNDALSSSIGPRRCHGPAAYGYWFSSIGNVLGAKGKMSGWSYKDTSNNVMVPGTPTIYALGWDDFVSGFPSIVADANVSSGSMAIIIHGNWDWVQSTQTFDSSIGNHNIPNSYYLSGPPDFFQNYTWPWVNPASGDTFVLPAKTRFDTNNPNGSTPKPAASAFHDTFTMAVYIR